MVISTILTRNPELNFQETVDLEELIQHGLQLMLKDTNQEPTTNLTLFYTMPVPQVSGYLARAVVNQILKGDLNLLMDSSSSSIEDREQCVIS